MATVSWDAHGIILIDFLQERQTITGEYYAIHLKLAHKKIPFHQDNVPAYISAVSMTKVHKFQCCKSLLFILINTNVLFSKYFLFFNNYL